MDDIERIVFEHPNLRKLRETLTEERLRIQQLEEALKDCVVALKKTEYGDRHGYDQKMHCFECGCHSPVHHEKCAFANAITKAKDVLEGKA